MTEHKKYLVIIDYGSEGWSIHGEADDWKQATELWKEAMMLSPRDCLILKNLPLKITTEKLTDKKENR